MKGYCFWFTGLSGAGKSTLAQALAKKFNSLGKEYEVLDGDEIRTHLSKGLGFSKEDRDENIKRVGYVASKMIKFGGNVICACISPYSETRDYARKLVKEANGKFIEIFVSTPLEECEKRDPKGLYKKVRAGEIKNFTGVDDPYENPSSPEIVLDTTNKTIEECISYILEESKILDKVKRAFFIGRWQPLHLGHEWLIRNKLDLGIPVTIAVRDIPPDEKNPYTTTETVEMIKAGFEGEDVRVIVIDDIESVNYGRGVGYEINEYKPPENIKMISATEIRKRINSNDESWKDFVNEKVAVWLKNYYLK